MSQENSKKSEDYEQILERINNKLSREILADDDLLLLASQSIKKTYTFEEKGYK